MASGASGVWFGNTQWPSGSSPGAFARDVYRIENCTTDRDKALALNSWLVRCMNRGATIASKKATRSKETQESM